MPGERAEHSIESFLDEVARILSVTPGEQRPFGLDAQKPTFIDGVSEVLHKVRGRGKPPSFSEL